MSLRGCECRCSIYSSSFSFKFTKDITVVYFVKVIVIFYSLGLPRMGYMFFL